LAGAYVSAGQTVFGRGFAPGSHPTDPARRRATRFHGLTRSSLADRRYVAGVPDSWSVADVHHNGPTGCQCQGVARGDCVTSVTWRGVRSTPSRTSWGRCTSAAHVAPLLTGCGEPDRCSRPHRSAHCVPGGVLGVAELGLLDLFLRSLGGLPEPSKLVKCPAHGVYQLVGGSIGTAGSTGTPAQDERSRCVLAESSVRDGGGER
jgi:hypothetical protein